MHNICTIWFTAVAVGAAFCVLSGKPPAPGCCCCFCYAENLIQRGEPRVQQTQLLNYLQHKLNSTQVCAAGGGGEAAAHGPSMVHLLQWH